MSNNLDQLFKKALQERSCEPPPYIWNKIEQRLDQRRRRIGGWWLRGAAAAALLAGVVAIWQLRQSEEEVKMAAISEIVVPLTTEDLSFVQVKTTGVEIEKKVSLLPPKIVIPAKIPTTLKRIESLPIVIASAVVFGLDHSTSEEVRLKVSTIRRNFIPLTSQDALKNNLAYQLLLQETPHPEKSENDKMKIALSGHFVPTYSSGTYSSSIKSPQGRSYGNNQMSGLMNAGGGLKIAVSTGKRFSLQTGLFYSRMGQKTTEKGGYVSMSTFDGQSEPRYLTPLGNVKSRTKAVAYRNPGALILNSVGNTDQTLEQVFGTLEIPLQMRYKLNDNKFSFSVVGGFSGNFIVNNKVYLKSGGDKELIGSTEDIRNFNMSTDWGLGVEYPLTRKIKVMVEPGFRYYLQSLSHNRAIDFKPYMFTFSTGIGIEF
ncbi:MAG: hypothetical protein RR397_08400 [Odoribacter sp.]